MSCCNCEDKLNKLTALVKTLADAVEQLEFDFYHSEVKISNISRRNLNSIILELQDL